MPNVSAARSGEGTTSGTITLFTNTTNTPDNVAGFELRCLSGIVKFRLDSEHGGSGVMLSAASGVGNHTWSPTCGSGRTFKSLSVVSAAAARIAWKPIYLR